MAASQAAGAKTRTCTACKPHHPGFGTKPSGQTCHCVCFQILNTPATLGCLLQYPVTFHDMAKG